MGRGAQRRPFVVLFGLFLVTTTASAAWHPLYSAPDEPTHLIRAAAVVRGQFRYAETTPVPGLRVSKVRVPRVFADSIYTPQCYFFKNETPASCAPLPAGTDDVDGLTAAGHYPPLYYLLVGAPTLIWKSNIAVYMVRLVGAALCSVFLAAAVSIAVRMRRPLLVAATAAAATPMVLYLTSVVNPSGLEISATLCFWTALAAVGLTRDLRWRGPLSWAVVSAVVVASVRPIGPLWVVVAVAITAASGLLSPIRELLRVRAVRRAAAIVAAAVLGTVAWLAIVGGAGLTGAPIEDPSRAWILSIGLTGQRLTQMVAFYGWLDAPVPIAVPIVWALVLVALVVAALAIGSRRRQIAGVLLLIVVVFAIPIPFEILQADTVGLFWQGRYTLPAAVGVPILVAAAASGRRLRRAATAAPLVAGLLVVMLAAHTVAVVSGIRRFAVGLSGPLTFFWDSSWDPPISHLLLAGAYVGGLAGISLYLALVVRRSTPELEGQAEPTPPG